MTNEQNGLSGIENLTPFEYALAGVNPASNQDSPSLAVVEQMRALAAEVQDAPVTQPRLQEFMHGAAGTAKRNERRALKRRRAAADGGFVDITPAELTEQNRSYAGDDGVPVSDGFTESDDVPESDGVPVSGAGSLAGLAALGGIAAGVSALDDDMAFAEAEPTSEQPAVNLSDDAVADEPADTFLDITDPIQLGEDGVVADLTDVSDVDAAPSVPAGLAEEDFERQFDAIQAAMLEDEAVEEPTFYEIPIDAEANIDDDGQLHEDLTAVGEHAGQDDYADDDAVAVGVSGLDAPPPLDEQLFHRTDDELIDPSGRFAGDHLFEPEAAAFEAEPTLRSEDEDPGTPVLVTAGGEGLLLDDEFDDSRNPLAVAALTGAVPPPVVPERRFGGAFWALAGTAAAAAVLALGGLLWANSLNDGNTTESASAAEETDLADSSQVSTDGTSEGSAETSDDAEDPSTAALVDGSEDAEDRPALAVDGEDTGPSTTLDPETTQTTVPADEGDETEEVPGTTAALGTETTAIDTETTEAPGSTEPPTTNPDEPVETTAVVPTTAPPLPDPTPAPTPAPIVRPSFIGDRVTLGSFDGPGIGGVRVRLFSDVDGNGIGEDRLAIDDTDEGGFYGFDEFPAGCYQVEFSRIPSGLSLGAEQASQSFCLAEGDQNGRFDAVAVVDPPDNCIVEASNNSRDRGVEVHENDFDRAGSYTFYNQNGGVVLRTSQAGPPDDLDTNPYGDYEWFAEDSGFNHRNVYSVAAERFGVESAPITCQRQ